jgi:lysozyme
MVEGAWAVSAEAFFDAARAYRRELTGEGLSQADVEAFNEIIASWNAYQASQEDAGAVLTARVALEIIGHEAIVQEAYKDSEGVWTWGIGVTNASGHEVYPRYKDNPQPIAKCIEIYLWLLRTKYIPDVEKAFAGCKLTEAQFAAALSFHYNTGAIKKADWVIRFRAGDIAAARTEFMNWRKPAAIIPRRAAERDLFFDGKWSQDGAATVYPVKKPSYTPDWSHAHRADVSQIVKALLP